MALTKTAVFDIAEDLLASIVTRLTAAAPGPALTLPARRYVHAGEVAFDCEQLVVSVAGLEHAMPGAAAEIAVCAPPRHIALDVWLIRCVPTQDDRGDPPSETALTTSAAQVLTDLWSLAYVLWVGRSDWDQTCASVLLGAVETVGPQGKFGGTHAQIFLQLI